MDSEGRALELAIALTPKAVLWFEAMMDSEGRLLGLVTEGRALELAIALRPKAVPWFEATMDSEGRLLGLVI
jgi:hypothetical protein